MYSTREHPKTPKASRALIKQALDPGHKGLPVVRS